MTTQSIKKYGPQEIVETAKRGFESWDEGTLEAMMLFTKAQQLLLEGRPVSPDQIGARLRMPKHQAMSFLGHVGAALDEEGNLVGLGLSVVPTQHSYKINGRQLYVWCAADAISFPILHKATAVIASPDPISGELVRLTSSPEGVSGVEPSTAVATIVTGQKGIANIRANVCNHQHFFTSVDTAAEYVSRHPGLAIATIEDVFQAGQILREQEPFKSLIARL